MFSTLSEWAKCFLKEAHCRGAFVEFFCGFLELSLSLKYKYFEYFLYYPENCECRTLLSLSLISRLIVLLSGHKRRHLILMQLVVIHGFSLCNVISVLNH